MLYQQEDDDVPEGVEGCYDGLDRELVRPQPH
jgi:hypothetical protein